MDRPQRVGRDPTAEPVGQRREAGPCDGVGGIEALVEQQGCRVDAAGQRQHAGQPAQAGTELGGVGADAADELVHVVSADVEVRMVAQQLHCGCAGQARDAQGAGPQALAQHGAGVTLFHGALQLLRVVGGRQCQRTRRAMRVGQIDPLRLRQRRQALGRVGRSALLGRGLQRGDQRQVTRSDRVELQRAPQVGQAVTQTGSFGPGPKRGRQADLAVQAGEDQAVAIDRPTAFGQRRQQLTHGRAPVQAGRRQVPVCAQPGQRLHPRGRCRAGRVRSDDAQVNGRRPGPLQGGVALVQHRIQAGGQALPEPGVKRVGGEQRHAACDDEAAVAVQRRLGGFLRACMGQCQPGQLLPVDAGLAGQEVQIGVGQRRECHALAVEQGRQRRDQPIEL